MVKVRPSPQIGEVTRFMGATKLQGLIRSPHPTLRMLSDLSAVHMTAVMSGDVRRKTIFIVPGAKPNNIDVIRSFYPDTPVYVFNPADRCASDRTQFYSVSHKLQLFL